MTSGHGCDWVLGASLDARARGSIFTRSDPQGHWGRGTGIIAASAVQPAISLPLRVRGLSQTCLDIQVFNFEQRDAAANDAASHRRGNFNPVTPPVRRHPGRSWSGPSPVFAARDHTHSLPLPASLRVCTNGLQTSECRSEPGRRVGGRFGARFPKSDSPGFLPPPPKMGLGARRPRAAAPAFRRFPEK